MIDPRRPGFILLNEAAHGKITLVFFAARFSISNFAAVASENRAKALSGEIQEHESEKHALREEVTNERRREQGVALVQIRRGGR